MLEISYSSALARVLQSGQGTELQLCTLVCGSLMHRNSELNVEQLYSVHYSGTSNSIRWSLLGQLKSVLIRDVPSFKGIP